MSCQSQFMHIKASQTTLFFLTFYFEITLDPPSKLQKREFLYALQPASSNVNILYTIVQLSKPVRLMQYWWLILSVLSNYKQSFHNYSCKYPLMPCVSGVPGTTLWEKIHWKDSQVSEKLLHSVMAYYSKRIQTKISKEKRRMSKVQQKQGTSFLVFKLFWSCMDELNSPSNNVWQHMGGDVNQESLPKPWCPEVLLGVSHKLSRTCMTNHSFQIPVPRAK